jgi:hypothetical protein
MTCCSCFSLTFPSSLPLLLLLLLLLLQVHSLLAAARMAVAPSALASLASIGTAMELAGTAAPGGAAQLLGAACLLVSSQEAWNDDDQRVHAAAGGVLQVGAVAELWLLQVQVAVPANITISACSNPPAGGLLQVGCCRWKTEGTAAVAAVILAVKEQLSQSCMHGTHVHRCCCCLRSPAATLSELHKVHYTTPEV